MGAVDLLQAFSPVSLVVSLLLVYLLLLLSTSSSQKHRRGPPGPKPLPLLGNLLQLDFKRVDKTLVEFSKTFGSVFSVSLGPKKVVVLSGYKTVKEALVNHAEAFGERDVPLVTKEAGLNHGIAWTNGETWREMRRFALMNLKDFGMGKRASEDKIVEETQHLIQEFKKFKGEAFDMTQLLNFAVSNIVTSMVYGSRFEYDDPEFRTIVNRTTKALHLLGSSGTQLYNMFPLMGKLLFFSGKKLKNIFEANKNHHLKLLSHLKETLNPQMCRGVADAFLILQQKQQDSGIIDSPFNSENLLVSVMNLFAAGTETTSTTLRWGLLFMAKYPEIQDRVQEELRRVIGARQVLAEDRQNLPFTNAVVHETQRLANVAPLSLTHRTSQDVTFQGHFIQKGTPVIPLLTSVLLDETEWEEPNVYHPAHFLDKDGKFMKRDAFLPFSAGSRMCLGESLARMELFLFFSTLLQHFRFTPNPGVSEEELDLTPEIGITLRPPPHKLCAVSLM